MALVTKKQEGNTNKRLPIYNQTRKLLKSNQKGNNKASSVSEYVKLSQRECM